jgi:hypothetical protein
VFVKSSLLAPSTHTSLILLTRFIAYFNQKID